MRGCTHFSAIFELAKQPRQPVTTANHSSFHIFSHLSMSFHLVWMISSMLRYKKTTKNVYNIYYRWDLLANVYVTHERRNDAFVEFQMTDCICRHCVANGKSMNAVQSFLFKWIICSLRFSLSLNAQTSAEYMKTKRCPLMFISFGWQLFLLCS